MRVILVDKKTGKRLKLKQNVKDWIFDIKVIGMYLAFLIMAIAFVIRLGSF